MVNSFMLCQPQLAYEMGDNKPQSPVTDTGTTDSTESGNKTVIVDGDPVTIDETTTAGELKELAGKDKDMIVTYREGSKMKGLTDDDSVLNHVPDGSTLSFQPAKGSIFGTASTLPRPLSGNE